jgi:hypothetical protein
VIESAGSYVILTSVSLMEVPDHLGDLNGWQLHAGTAFDQQLGEAVAQAIPSSRESVTVSGAAEPLGPRRDVARNSAIAGAGSVDPATIPRVGQSSAPTPAERLAAEIETILYHHVLLDDTRQATRNLRHIESAIESWPSSKSGQRSGPALASGSTALDQRLEQLWYDHFLGDTPMAAGTAIDTLRGTVREWSSDLASDSVGRNGGDLLADPGAQRWASDHGLAPELALDAVALGGPAFDI